MNIALSMWVFRYTVVGWVGVTMDTFSENGTVLSYKLTEGNHIGDGEIWEFVLLMHILINFIKLHKV